MPQRSEDGKTPSRPATNEEVRSARSRTRRLRTYAQLLARRDHQIEQLQSDNDGLRATNRQLEMTLQQKVDHIAFLEDRVRELTDRVTALSQPVVTGPDAS